MQLLWSKSNKLDPLYTMHIHTTRSTDEKDRNRKIHASKTNNPQHGQINEGYKLCRIAKRIKTKRILTNEYV